MVPLCFAITTSYAQTKEWTMIIYLNGSDLESGSNAGSIDLNEMMAAGSTDNVNVIVLTGGANKTGWQTIKSWKIENGQQLALDFTPIDDEMSNPANLTSFINWTTDSFPAEKYVLDLWNHGMAIRGYGHDENTDAHFTVPDLIAAIDSTTFTRNGNYFELIGFDACLMSTIEVQSGLKDYGEYFIGSEETEPGHGWNYTPIIEAMENGDVENGAELGTVIVDGFFDQAFEEGTENVTLAVTDLTLVQPIVDALQTLMTKIEADSLNHKLQKARSMAQEYSKAVHDAWNSEDMVDIGDLMKKLKSVEPSLSVESDAVLDAVNNAVWYTRNDETRPGSNGITMFLPHNKFEDDEALEAGLEDYNPIEFSSTVRSYVNNTYIPFAQGDNSPPEGEHIEEIGFHSGGSPESGNPDSVSAILVTHTDDLEEVRMVLLEHLPGNPDELFLLGSTLPDTSIAMPGNTEIFGYFWDGLWLGINGDPVYIADIYEYEDEDEFGNPHNYIRVLVPAIWYPKDGGEKDVIISYRIDEDYNFTQESIVPETYGDNVLVPGKERIELVPGDQIQPVYEIINLSTDEEFYAVDDNIIFTIENGNEDLDLAYDYLPPGDYEMGVHLLDHSHNDTLIIDDKIFTVITTSEAQSFAYNNVEMYPIPSDNMFYINNEGFDGHSYTVKVFSANGKEVHSGIYNEQHIAISTSRLPDGFYKVQLIAGQKIMSDKLIIQH